MTKQYEKYMAEQYNQYYQSGLYQTRYPNANPNVLGFIHAHLSLLPLQPTSQVLDFGCGQGRYLLALSTTYNVHFLGYDISKRAINDLNELLQLNQISDKKVRLFSQSKTLEDYLDKKGPVLLTLMMFGVLSHISKDSERINTLKKNASQLTPNEGRMLLSVPNRYRRFLAKQCIKVIKSGRIKNSENIEYTRSNNIKLSYHLYSKRSLLAELKAANLELLCLRAESILPEKWVLSHPLIARLDQALCYLLPSQCSYGFLALVKPISTKADTQIATGGEAC
ncbi:methyltransferase domain-containing protein [Marinomonas sp. MED121]|uniref:class I SAM-dependent methyltransferase n=1 Tax=Marinomonas sp. MED121 TaxID=314277 RepID=UPI0002E039C4|nr:methyltransferase domain-containing protein [Marinomonas sp. MED121]